MAVPIALEAVHAGFPSVAQDYFSGDFSFDTNVITHPDTSFIVRVSGTSMTNAGIFDGDLAIVDRSLTPQDGDIVIAALDGELTVKRLISNTSGQPVLHAENSQFPDIQLYFDESVTIWGVVIGNYHPQCERATIRMNA
ncbi:translesion error-prone DNA polymerase V autoproteolytic subunit [Alloscardovia theropitheci]|uniref:Translesion error-prone DNA polymerase V autoproteolytic subunit n=1 Tax=Alloscardovia theropitheci TaxID=2496842 RepID=A0A4R0R0M3_9BIFI|nr:S24 family peptidase [Alloscardovia theropitheci]TCD54606.1 translesion error-prone DNA polymerase V autoproteolytic subunit [Alloscardovia theropitheci]